MKLIYKLCNTWILFMFIFLFEISFATDSPVITQSFASEVTEFSIDSHACILVDLD